MSSARSVIKLHQSETCVHIPNHQPSVEIDQTSSDLGALIAKATLTCQTFGFWWNQQHGNAGEVEWGGLGDEELSFAFLPTCHVKPWLTKWTLSSPDMAAADLARSVWRAHLPTCPSTATAGCHFVVAHSGRWREGQYIPPLHLEIEPPNCMLSFMAAVLSLLSWHAATELRWAATCTGTHHPNSKPEQYAIPLNLDQIPLSLQTSVACRCWVWISVSQSKFLKRSNHRVFSFFFFLQRLTLAKNLQDTQGCKHSASDLTWLCLIGHTGLMLGLFDL